ncbi:MAG: phage integrase N-terminal SAM-like domain-containing protein [Leptospiraceae bacterium]|nr:phage integrase N-terminal SAM-like domain-containing protein [Leptospiraceae bacterium]
MIRELKLKTMSEKTIKSYVSYVNYLAKYYKKSPDKINREEVKNYLYHLRVNKQLSANTLNVVQCDTIFLHSCY